MTHCSSCEELRLGIDNSTSYQTQSQENQMLKIFDIQHFRIVNCVMVHQVEYINSAYILVHWTGQVQLPYAKYTKLKLNVESENFAKIQIYFN